jgi:hypothetical protein
MQSRIVAVGKLASATLLQDITDRLRKLAGERLGVGRASGARDDGLPEYLAVPLHGLPTSLKTNWWKSPKADQDSCNTAAERCHRMARK